MYTKYYSYFIIYDNAIAYRLIYFGNEYNERNMYILFPKKRITIHVMRNKFYTNNGLYELLALKS
jgi:hypothetical protein